ncbi:MAG: PAS domain S-box protein [Myxococcota bacterium]
MRGISQSEKSAIAPSGAAPESRESNPEGRDYRERLLAQNEELRATQERLEASRLEYFQLFEDSPISMIVTDDRGWVVKMNNSARQLLGIVHDGVRRGPMVAWVDVEHHDRFFDHLRRARRRAARVLTEVRLSGSASRRTVRLVTDPFGPTQMLTAIVDITEIREAERARRHIENRYRRLFSASRDALLVVEADSARITDAPRCSAGT